MDRDSSTSRRDFGPYILDAPLGEGGMGTVYRAIRKKDGKLFALKLISASSLSNELAIKRFQKEAECASQVQHPNIVKTFGLGRVGNDYYILMDIIEGESLSNVIKKAGRVAPDEAIRISVAICDALAAVHALGIVHRDVKPSNIVLDSDVLPKLVDFGVAKIPWDFELGGGRFAGAGKATPTVTAGIGTLCYMSPEQLKGEPLDGRADIYSLGVTMFEMLTGHRPFDERSQNALVIQILTGAAVDIDEARPELPTELRNLVRSMMNVEVAQRPRTSADVLHELMLISKESSTWYRFRRHVAILLLEQYRDYSTMAIELFVVHVSLVSAIFGFVILVAYPMVLATTADAHLVVRAITMLVGYLSMFSFARYLLISFFQTEIIPFRRADNGNDLTLVVLATPFVWVYFHLKFLGLDS